MEQRGEQLDPGDESASENTNEVPALVIGEQAGRGRWRPVESFYFDEQFFYRHAGTVRLRYSPRPRSATSHVVNR